MRPRFDRRGLIVIALAASLAAPILLGGIGALTALDQLSPLSIVAILGVTVASWLARAAKMAAIARRLGVPMQPLVAVRVSLATDFAFMTTPGGLGGYAANVVLLRRVGATLPTATAIAAADQVIDVAFFAVALPIAALFAIGSDASSALMHVSFVTGAALCALIAAAFVLRRPLRAWLTTAAGNAQLRRPRIAAWAALLADALHDMARVLDSPRFGFAVLALTAVQWFTRYGVLWVVLIVGGHAVPYSVTLLAQAVMLHAAQWTGLPSGAGAADLGIAAALAPWLTTSASAAACLLWRLATLHLALVAGGFAWLGVPRARAEPQSALP